MSYKACDKHFCYVLGIEDQAGHWWLMLVILASQEAMIRRITVPSQLGQIGGETLSGKCPTQKQGWWSGSGRSLPRKHEALSSNPSSNKKNK
jgi:hypothetical protein